MKPTIWDVVIEQVRCTTNDRYLPGAERAKSGSIAQFFQLFLAVSWFLLVGLQNLRELAVLFEYSSKIPPTLLRGTKGSWRISSRTHSTEIEPRVRSGLLEPHDEVAGDYRRSDDTRNVRPHGVHEEIVVAVCLLPFQVSHSRSHGNR